MQTMLNISSQPLIRKLSFQYVKKHYEKLAVYSGGWIIENILAKFNEDFWCGDDGDIYAYREQEHIHRIYKNGEKTDFIIFYKKQKGRDYHYIYQQPYLDDLHIDGQEQLIMF